MIYYVIIYDDFGVMREPLISAFNHWVARVAARTTSAFKRSARWQAPIMVQYGRTCRHNRAYRSRIGASWHLEKRSSGSQLIGNAMVIK